MAKQKNKKNPWKRQRGTVWRDPDWHANIQVDELAKKLAANQRYETFSQHQQAGVCACQVCMEMAVLIDNTVEVLAQTIERTHPGYWKRAGQARFNAQLPIGGARDESTRDRDRPGECDAKHSGGA